MQSVEIQSMFSRSKIYYPVSMGIKTSDFHYSKILLCIVPRWIVHIAIGLELMAMSNQTLLTHCLLSMD